MAFTEQDARAAYAHARDFVEDCTPRDAGTVRGMIAANWILDKTSSTGVDIRRVRFSVDTPRGTRELTNLSSEFKTGPDAPWVVIVSHFDTKPGISCPGANDGASTTGLLMALASALSRENALGGNVMLVWTDGEECMESYSPNDGLHGSRHAAEILRRRGLDVRAVICLDMLGDRDLNISIPSNGSPALSKIALLAAERAGLPKGTVEKSDIVVKDDHVPFMDAGFSALALIDFNYGSAPGLNDYWHTPKDTMDKVSEESLLKSGRLVAEMLEILLPPKSAPEEKKEAGK